MYWCTGVLLLKRTQYVLALGMVVVEVLERDFVAPVLCGPNFLLVVLPQPLLIGVNHLFPL